MSVCVVSAVLQRVGVGGLCGAVAGYLFHRSTRAHKRHGAHNPRGRGSYPSSQQLPHYSSFQ